jgi:predicted MFS family arabinose efflux permease
MLRYTATIYRNAYSGLSKGTWLLSTIMLINRSGTMVVPFMTLYLTSEEMGYSVAQAGVVFGLFGFGAFCGAYFGGRLTDKIGFYPVQMMTLIGGGILFMLLGQMKHYGLICLFTYLLSFVNEAFRPANSTAIAFYSKDENRTRSYSLNRLAVNLGWAVGSGLGGFIAHISYELLFWVDGFTNIVAALLLWLLYQTKRNSPSNVLRTRIKHTFFSLVW